MMARYERFTFLVSKEEREKISRLAALLQRSQSDAVRWIVLQAVKELDDTTSNKIIEIPANKADES